MNEQIRRKWLKLARRDDARILSVDSRMYFCEDHFDMPNDMTNFMEYQIMGKVSKILMKSGCIPTKFECQEDRRKRMSSIIERPYIVKKQRTETIAECLNEYNKSCTTSSSLEDTSNIISNCKLGEENVQEVISKTSDKFVQALITHKFRSKAVQAGPKYKDQALSPLKPSLVSSFTSPFKVKTFKKSRPSEMGKITRNIFTEDEPSDGEISLYSGDIRSHSPSVHSLQTKSSSDCSEILEDYKKQQQATETLSNTLKKIEKKPRLYIAYLPRFFSLDLQAHGPVSYVWFLEFFHLVSKIQVYRQLFCND
ncbi:hypothetical protein EVAR_10283_1 [Eumeta japonica]|uniref:THAP-type domain-containing protein n=1 Tax=Eumeta variegata TaxID=151549 RepID=A0A4C1TGS9_EUMVA|nr:hypothetical protein EVAR_10283_1 [Eumeta japonica]